MAFSTYEIILTNTCNCQCAYCYALPTNTPAEIPLANIEKIIAFIEKSYDRSAPEVTLVFFGGEPLLAFAVLKKYIEHFKRHAVFRFVISTNLTTPDREQLDYLIDHNVAFQVSLDGKAKSHDLNRGAGRYAQTMQRVAYVIAKNANVRLRMTVTHNTLAQFAENLLFLNSLRIPFIWLFDTASAYSEEELKSILAQLHFVAERMGGNAFDQTIHEFLQRQNEAYHCIDPNKTISIRYDGKLLPCNRLSDELGDVILGLSVRGQNPLAGNQPSACYNCQSFVYCKGGCLGAHRESGEERNKTFCDIQRLLHIFVLENTIKVLS